MTNKRQELYHKYRPTTYKELVGQREAVKVLRTMTEANRIPHAIMLVGPSGCGKTTIARILKNKLKCSDKDFREINCASLDKAIDTIRSIESQAAMAPMLGPVRVFLLDEVQSLSRAGFSQQALLKILEDMPSHVYFMLATTDPTKVIDAIKTRCTQIVVQPVNNKDMLALLQDVAQKEGMEVGEETYEAIIERAVGSPRRALVDLDKLVGIDDPEEQLKALVNVQDKKRAIDLCRVLFQTRASWSDVIAILRDFQDDPEETRRAVLGYACSIMLKNGKGKMLARASVIIDAFETDYYASGKAGLVNSCFKVVMEGDQ